ncbi:pectinesterase inhibitor 3-like [Telopea speciosissima]|uniref:pectinesterase inhibitor 3-like n=1 Tax=Telopea speciosissima TaxID=54955 RepID=UPI001CC3A432|nr:pectinesterase inhibitor 3-like [Telopea speciosissima]
MKSWVPTSSFFFFLLYVSSAAADLRHSTTAGSSGKSGSSEDLVRNSCIHASYPDLCLRTLSTYGAQAKTPNDLAQAAVNVSLSRARKVSQYLSRLATSLGGEGSNKKQRLAVTDCVDQLSDSVDELSKTLSELRDLRDRSGKFRMHMSNAETWVSAALTNEDTCLDGFQDVGGSSGTGKNVKSDVKRKMSNVAKVTSNALYLINRLDDARGR